MSRSSKFSCYVTISLSFSSSTRFSQIQHPLLDWNFSSSSMVIIKFLLKFFFSYFLTVIMLFKNSFDKSIGSIFTCIKNSWFSKFIISANKLIENTARTVILIFLCVRTIFFFSSFNTGRNTLTISIILNRLGICLEYFFNSIKPFPSFTV